MSHAKNTHPPVVQTASQTSNSARLNKAIAAAGFCSRRAADALIFAHRVSVNNEPENNPARHVLPEDIISVDGQPLPAAQEFTYVMLHKPPQVVCTAHDPEGRETVLDFLSESLRKIRLYPVGRLDYFSEGLLLLTNDGDLALRLTHPRHHQSKTYEVLVRGDVTHDALTAMREGMRLREGEKLLPAEVATVTTDKDTTLLHILLHQGVNRQIRRMCRDLGLTILRLRRLSQGTLTLGTLKPGKSRLLSADEISALKSL